ncbi:UNVERIFIED_CONTAM: hypothetical protein FKN15_057368 [Acipenser sinensis]
MQRDSGTAIAMQRDSGTAMEMQRDSGTAMAMQRDSGTAMTMQRDSGTAMAMQRDSGTAMAMQRDSACLVHLVELTVPWEDAADEVYERKKLGYAQLATEAEQRGWRVRVYPVEVGCRGFVAHSTTRFLRDVGFSGQELRRTVKNLSEAAERSSN